jgi:hypothetical protein
MKKEYEYKGWTVWFNREWGASLSRKGRQLIIIKAASEEEIKKEIDKTSLTH